jgi:hypothetical protein
MSIDRATAWTRPLQFLAGLFWSATALLNTAVTFVIYKQLVPNFETNLNQMPSAPPTGAHDTALVYAGVQVSITVLLLGVFVVLALGSWWRTVWSFWTTIVVLALGSPFNLMLNGLGVSAALSYAPSWVETAFVIDSVTGLIVLATLLALAIRVGPWGLRQPILSMASPPGSESLPQHEL